MDLCVLWAGVSYGPVRLMGREILYMKLYKYYSECMLKEEIVVTMLVQCIKLRNALNFCSTVSSYHILSFILILWILTGLQNPYGYGNSQYSAYK